MYSTDLNVNAAVERSVDRVRAVQAYGATHVAPARWIAALLGLAALAVAVVVVLPAIL
jgi:hypothetical protein